MNGRDRLFLYFPLDLVICEGNGLRRSLVLGTCSNPLAEMSINLLSNHPQWNDKMLSRKKFDQKNAPFSHSLKSLEDIFS